MSVLEQFGVDAAKVASLSEAPRYPKEVPGRVAHIDADFIAYQVSAERKDELDPNCPIPRKTFEDMKHNAQTAIKHLRSLAGAGRAVIHTTHNSDKGGRDEQAILKRYQANRLNRDNRPEHLDAIREWLGQGCGLKGVVGVNHTDQEADDGMTQASYADPENHVVVSADKDLLMIPGLHMNPNESSPVITKTDAFGWITRDKTPGGTIKIGGRGTKFFWTQMLMGDPADNISGCPMVPGKIAMEASPTKEYTKLLEQWKACSADETVTIASLDGRLKKLEKPKKCGPSMAYDIISPLKTDKECYDIVKQCYEDNGVEYVHWNTGEPVTATKALFSEMQLLWMRRSKDPLDVLHWLKEEVLK